MEFRSDINGLRAFAVLMVLLYHMKVPIFSGGFVGVDIFFVISGYLMTGIILKKKYSTGNFRLLDFYFYRARRIVPALLVLCAVLLSFGYFCLDPFIYKDLGRAAASSLLFISNITYWKQSGYFAPASEENWLLHTWSLSLEWQFYFLYPIFIILIGVPFNVEHRARVIKLSIWLLFILSIFLSVIFTNLRPVPAFYLLPTRGWELLAGGLIFIYKDRIRLTSSSKNWIEAIGLFCLAVSIILFNNRTPWPGYFAAVPVLGAGLVIASNNQKSWVTNNFICQSIGRWSYSIYLWHWVFVAGGVYFEIPSSASSIALFLAASILSGFLSYQFIELPAKNIFIPARDRFTLIYKFATLGISVLFLEAVQKLTH